ncbi:GNAT family N-acetyltransferase [Streptomyces sp. DSM 44917]|uniref:GNAT family N-acetyltransferase n=1 Tax=Streptomyces boetiae TaxID=3075541 RepID=A0ABU2L2N2_9ACTN|nr:GNAT family N-acetyltransferase [Streptomyces sp. DSM 44917]MDT0305829.1 GNAT family N-acetyltransferase [Streptomyces sp. DSM 44917]
MRGCSAAEAALEARGLAVRVEEDPAGWVRHLRAAPGGCGVNPAFDPGRAGFGAGEGFWLAAVAADGGLAGCCACRLLPPGPFLGLLRTGRLWAREPRAGDPGPALCLDPGRLPGFRGAVGHIGGLWVHPARRRSGLAGLLLQATRAQALARWDPLDWETALSFAAVAESPGLRAAYRFEHTVPCVDGWFPPTGRAERVHLNYSSRRHLLARLGECGAPG